MTQLLKEIVKEEYEIEIPEQLTKLIVSFDLQLSFNEFFEEMTMDFQFVIGICPASFYDEIIDEFKNNYFKHNKDSKIDLRVKDIIPLKGMIKEIIILRNQL